MRRQAWSDGSFFPVVNRSARSLVDVGATVVWAVEAASWEEAMTAYHKWRGREPYRPMNSDPMPYTATEEAEAARVDGWRAVRGVTADTSPVRNVTVNGHDARPVRENLAEWEVEFDAPPGKLTVAAGAVDRVGNTEETPHVVQVD